MTDREVMQMALDALDSKHDMTKAEWRVLQYRAFTALRSALAQPEPTNAPQEPVAWADRYDLDREGHDFWVSRQASVRTGVPLYTAPPQREWQGLTDEEIKNHWLIAMQSVEGTVLPIPEFALAIEHALKEKNHG